MAAGLCVEGLCGSGLVWERACPRTPSLASKLLQSLLAPQECPREFTLPQLSFTVQRAFRPAPEDIYMAVSPSAGARFRRALQANSPLQIVGAINAYSAMLAQRAGHQALYLSCLLYTSPSPRDVEESRMPSSA